MLRYAPLTEDGDPIWESTDYRRQAGLARKMSRVAQRGAAAVLLVNPPGHDESNAGLMPIQRSRRFARRASTQTMKSRYRRRTYHKEWRKQHYDPPSPRWDC